MQRTTTNPTRRAMLGGAVIALAATASIVPASGGTDGVSPELVALIEASRKADADCEAFNAVYDDVRNQWMADVAALPVTTASYVNVLGDRHTLSTAWPIDLKTAQSLLAMSAGGVTTEAGEAASKIIAAHVDLQRQKDALRTHHKIDDMLAQSNAMSDAGSAAIDAVSAFKARNIADLEVKLSFLMDRGWLDCENARVDLLADVRRLAGKEA